MNSRQRKFIDAYTGNAAQAAIAAGYSAKSARAIGRENLTKPDILEAIREREQERRDELIGTREERQIFWTAIMRDEAAEMKDRLHASELLGKSEGDFIERTEITGKDGAPVSTIDFSTRSTEELIAIVEAGRCSR
ncbi:hypothetical protein FACS1894216_18580 [Synergistales bacterium]|nr:hypothetical protein FACS1894216_18580 [Synergistales bacterium]